MKKALIMIMILCLLFLSGCVGKRLENAYFANTKEDSFEEAYFLFSDYVNRVKNDMEEYYPRSSQYEALWEEDSFINAQLLGKDSIYRHEFYNYHLSDDRLFMRYSQLYYVIDATLIWNGLLGMHDQCDSIKEGERCDVTEQSSKYGLIFYKEGNELYLEFMFSQNPPKLFYFVFHFYENDQLEDVMEMTLHIPNLGYSSFETMSWTKLVFGKSVEEYLCNGCDPEDASKGSLEYLYTEWKEKPYQTYAFETSNVESFIHLYLLNGTTYGEIFDGSTGELFDATVSNGTFESRSYAKYIRNTLVVDYSPTHYLVNLQEVLGWDRLEKIPDESNAFRLMYKDEVLSDQYIVKIQSVSSEYPYFESMSSQLSDDVLSLGIFGLTTLYDSEYFQEKFELGATRLGQVLETQQLNHDYADNQATFLALINKFRES